MNSINKQWIFKELKKATKNITITTSDELQAVVGEASLDELALDFENFLTAATPFLQEADLEGLKLLQSIDNKLERISGASNRELWTARAFLEDQRWAEIRQDAWIAIEYFDWH